jgi:Zn-dependent protease
MAGLIFVGYVMLLGIPAMLLHESGHIVVAWLCGVKVKKVGISRVGLYTVREAGPNWANLCVSAAGPLVNLLLAVLLRNVSPTFALVNLVAFAYNMLPIPNSDGKRVLSILRAGTSGMSWSAHSYATQAVQPSRR